MSENSGLHERLTIRLPKKYLALLDQLVSDGVYNSRNEAVRDGLRLLYIHHGLEISTPKTNRPN